MKGPQPLLDPDSETNAELRRQLAAAAGELPDAERMNRLELSVTTTVMNRTPSRQPRRKLAALSLVEAGEGSLGWRKLAAMAGALAASAAVLGYWAIGMAIEPEKNRFEAEVEQLDRARLASPERRLELAKPSKARARWRTLEAEWCALEVEALQELGREVEARERALKCP